VGENSFAIDLIFVEIFASKVGEIGFRGINGNGKYFCMIFPSKEYTGTVRSEISAGTLKFPQDH
jgi:hypothetical protein